MMSCTGWPREREKAYIAYIAHTYRNTSDTWIGDMRDCIAGDPETP